MGKKLSKFNEKPIENRYLARKTRKFSACGAVLVRKIVIFTIFSDKIAAEGRENFWGPKNFTLVQKFKKHCWSPRNPIDHLRHFSGNVIVSLRIRASM